MAEAARIRATVQGDGADVRVVLPHPMETGQRKNEKGEIVPAHFITQVVASHNGKPVFTAQLSQGVAANPFLAFKVKGAKAGDKIGLSWVDNRGEKGSVETSVGSA